jgi:hypothetical protein
MANGNSIRIRGTEKSLIHVSGLSAKKIQSYHSRWKFTYTGPYAGEIMKSIRVVSQYWHHVCITQIPILSCPYASRAVVITTATWEFCLQHAHATMSFANAKA